MGSVNTSNKDNVMSKTHFANILMTNDHPMGRMHAPKRKKGDWFHSIAVFANESINDLPIGGHPIDCIIVHFFGDTGSPVLSYLESTIRCTRKHMGTKLYNIEAWNGSTCVIGDIRTDTGYKPGYGSSEMAIPDIVRIAVDKWGDNKIPYAHQRNEAYNCVSFVDDILHWSVTCEWNPRIVNMHEKHMLCV